MGWFDHHEDSYNQVDNYQYGDDQQPHKASLTHELLAGAVTYEAAKEYENRGGVPHSHARAKEIFAGIAGAAADRLAETKGRDLWDQYDRQSVLQTAQDNFSQQYGNQQYGNQQYGNQQSYDNQQSYSDDQYSQTTTTTYDQQTSSNNLSYTNDGY